MITDHQNITWINPNEDALVDDTTESDDVILSLRGTLQASRTTHTALRPNLGIPSILPVLSTELFKCLSAVLRLIRVARQTGGVNGSKWRGSHCTFVSPLTMRTAQLLTPVKTLPLDDIKTMTLIRSWFYYSSPKSISFTSLFSCYRQKILSMKNKKLTLHLLPQTSTTFFKLCNSWRLQLLKCPIRIVILICLTLVRGNKLWVGASTTRHILHLTTTTGHSTDWWPVTPVRVTYGWTRTALVGLSPDWPPSSHWSLSLCSSRCEEVDTVTIIPLTRVHFTLTRTAGSVPRTLSIKLTLINKHSITSYWWHKADRCPALIHCVITTRGHSPPARAIVNTGLKVGCVTWPL